MAPQEPRRLGSAIVSILFSLGLFFLLWQIIAEDLPAYQNLSTAASQPASGQLAELQRQIVFWKLSATQTLGVLALFLSRRAKHAGVFAKLSLVISALQLLAALGAWGFYLTHS